jgi:8-oxo-dGTP diphosphatase
MIRRHGETVKSGQRYTLRPGVYAILPRGDDLLLTFQAEPLPELQLPGGGIDKGEDPVRALHREVYEETGWHIAAPRRLGAYRRFTYMPEYDLWAEKLCHIYIATPTLRLGPPVEELHTALWCPAQEAASLLANSGERAFLGRLLGRWSRVR